MVNRKIGRVKYGLSFLGCLAWLVTTYVILLFMEQEYSISNRVWILIFVLAAAPALCFWIVQAASRMRDVGEFGKWSVIAATILVLGPSVAGFFLGHIDADWAKRLRNSVQMAALAGHVILILLKSKVHTSESIDE